MNIKYILVAAALSCGLVSVAQSQSVNPITKAMMEVYQQELDADPQNYEVYFRRASEYYNLSQYLRALDDVNAAIKYTPVTDTDLLFQEYTLRANIYTMTDRKEDALLDLDQACRLDKTSTTALYLKANLEYELGKYTEAKADFNQLQRMDPRNLESLFGLAKVAVKENNLGLATEYADRAIALEPSNSVAYLQRASVRQLMGNNTGAVDDLILAISIDKDNSVALARLVAMSNSDYNAVITGLTSAIQQAPSVGMFIYLRAVIAMNHCRYKAAIDDFHTIIDENLYNYHGIYASLSECYLGLGKYQEALTEINQALSMTTDNGAYYITRAKIRRAMEDYDRALESATTALDKLPGSPVALVEKGLCYESLSKYNDASSLFGEAIMDEPDNALTYLIRARVLESNLKETGAARNLCQRVLDLDFPDNNIKSYKGFAMIILGRKADAISWIESIVNNNTDVDGSLNYYAACLYAQLNNKMKAYEHMERALENGYASYYNWTLENSSNVSVEPLRKEKRFIELLQQYNYLFEI
ncbi:MAG: tetratricopeptide repeat protein [Clostridiales bacterium]|nr:tetratricopeptide repeat protein [Clostridiales bacterium]